MKVASLNARGLNNSTKRKTLLHWIQDKHIDIVCLQETFFTVNTVHLLDEDWDGKTLHAPSPSSHSKGVSILFKKDLDIKIIDHYVTQDG